MVNLMENKTYNSNMIKKFIFRIDFVSDIEELKEGISDDLTSKIIENFPNSIMTDVVESKIEIKPNEIKKADKPFKQWEYISNDTKNKIVITPKTLIYDCSKYISFDDVLSKFEYIINEILKLTNVQIGRLGIRYVNVFESKDFDINDVSEWEEYFNSKLYSYYHFFTENDGITNMLNSIEYSYGDFRIKYKSGFNNKNYPLKIVKPDFVIDCDGYSNAIITSIDDLRTLINSIHNQIEILFENSITEKMREKLNG